MSMTHAARAVSCVALALTALLACGPERQILVTFDADPPWKQKDSGYPLCKYPGGLCASDSVCVDTGVPAGSPSGTPPVLVCKPCADQGTPQGCPIDCPAKWTRLDTGKACDVCACAPPNECISDKECPKGRCYPGQICDPGCNGSPECCHGNVCAASGCTDTRDVECTRVGCPIGQFCNADCAPPACSCDSLSGQWKCSGGCGAVCSFPK